MVQGTDFAALNLVCVGYLGLVESFSGFGVEEYDLSVDQTQQKVISLTSNNGRNPMSRHFYHLFRLGLCRVPYF